MKNINKEISSENQILVYICWVNSIDLEKWDVLS